MGNEQTPISQEGNEHLSPSEIGAWLGGDLPAAESDRLQEHFISCDDCRVRMGMIRQATRPQADLEQDRDFDRLLQLGQDAARKAWREREQEAPDPSRRGWLRSLLAPQPALRWAAAALAILAVGIPAYYFYQRNQPVERAMRSLRQVWTQSRPLEARVTGGFSYLPYEVKRSAKNVIPVNREKLLAAMAELARAVVERPTPENRQALGRLYLLTEELAQAEELLQLVIKQEPHNPSAYVDLAAVYFERGVREESLFSLTQAAELLIQATELSPRMPEARFNLALCQQRMLLPAQAWSNWNRYLEIDPSSPWAAEARELRGRMNAVENAVSAPAALAPEFLASIDFKNDMKFRMLMAQNFITIYELARAKFLDNYLAARIEQDQAAMERYLTTLWAVANFAKDVKAEHYLFDLVNFVSRAKISLAPIIRDIRRLLIEGDRSHEKGEYAAAIQCYEKAATLAESIRDVGHGMHAQYGLARIYIQKVETPVRMHLRERLVIEARSRNYRQLLAQGQLALANALGAKQLFSRGLSVSKAAFETAWEIEDYDTAVNSLRLSGAAQANLGNYGQAIAFDYQALRIISEKPVGDLRTCQAYLATANSFNKAAAPTLSVFYQTEALDYCRRTGNPSLPISTKAGLGKYLALANKSVDAERMFRESLADLQAYKDQLGESLLQTELNILLGDAYLRQSRPQEAATAYENSLKLVAGTDHRAYLAATHQGLAEAYIGTGRIHDAEKELQLSIELAEWIRKNIQETLSRSSFRARKLDVYRTMMNFKVSVHGDFEAAYYYLGLTQSRELYDTLSATSSIHSDISRSVIESALSEDALRIPDVQRIVPDDIQLVQYGLTDEQLLIWLIQKKSWKAYRIRIRSDEFHQLCASYLQDLYSKRDPKILNDKAAQLYQVLVKPLLPDLDPQRTQVFIPDGLLNAIPFAALYSADSGRYLIQDFTLTMAPSAAILAHTMRTVKKPRGAEDSILLVSNPKFSPQSNPYLKPLPAAHQEEETISAFYADSLQLDRERATKEAFLKNLPRFDIVHLATHSVIDENNPFLSSIILSSSGSESDDALKGNLRAYEIFDLWLPRPRLVILSSCGSGLTSQSSGNGVGSLAHAFFKAGVPSVIATLWEVEDRSAAELMKDFHKNYQSEKQSPGMALRHAQLRMLEQDTSAWKHPYYWASFHLSGDPRKG